MLISVLREKLICEEVTKKRRLRLLAATIAVGSFFPASPTFAATDEVEVVEVEDVAAPEEKVVDTKEVLSPAEEVSVEVTEESAVEAETNEDYLRYLELEDWLVTAERIPTSKWETPANVTVITAREIEENHYESIDEAIRYVNGVSIASMQMTGGKRILILVDGRRWFDPQTSSQEAKAYNGFPSMKMIERIEIVKGGQSALYGSDAFNGVINIVTKKGTRNETSINLSTGSWRSHTYEIANQGVAGKFGWFVTGELYKAHAPSHKSGLAEDFWNTDTDETSMHNFSVRLDQRFTDRDSLTFDVMHMSVPYRYYSNYYHDYVPNSSTEDIINNFSLVYNFKEGTSTPGWLRYVNNYYTTESIGTENPHSRLQGIEYQNGWELGQHKIIAGLEYHKSNASHVLHNFDDASMNTKSIYFQDTISMGDKWIVIPGVRYDNSSEFGTNWSPKIAANYRPDEKTKFYATWGKSYNVPLLNELYSNYPSDAENYSRIVNSDVPLFYIGLRNLRPEKGNSTIIGIEHDFDDKTGIGVSFFQNKLKNSLSWNFAGPYAFSDTGEYYYLQLAGNTYPLKSRGFEITFNQKIDDHFSYNLGYSYTHTHMQHPNSGSIPYYRPQPNSYRVGLNYRNRGLKASLLGIMANGINTNPTMIWSNTTTIQAYPKRRYADLNFILSYDLNEQTTFYFKALNFTNQHYSNQESSWYGYKQVYPARGRQFVYGVNYKF